MQLTVDGNLLSYNPYMTNAYIQGHLIVVPFGQKVFALDPLGLAGGGEKVLWVRDLVAVGGDAAKVGTAGRLRVNAVFGLSPFAYNSLPFGSNVVGAITSRYVCLHWMQDLVAVDPLNGQTLWMRRNIPVGSEIFGDEEFVFVAPPQSTPQTPGPRADAHGAGQLMVLRAADGQLLGFRPAPPVAAVADESANGAMAFVGGAAMMRWAMQAGGLVGAVSAAPAAANGVCFATIGRKMLVRKPVGTGNGTTGGLPKRTVPVSPRENRDSPPRIRLPVPGDGNRVQFALFDPWTQQTLWTSPAVSSRSKHAVLNEEAIGVLEPDGRFLLLDLADGRTIADVLLLPDEGKASAAGGGGQGGKAPPDALRAHHPGVATAIHVIRSGDEYLLFVSQNYRQKPGVFMPQQVPGAQGLGPLYGQLYAIDGKGKLMWPGPVEIEEAYFLQNQPQRIPAVVFASQRYEQQNNRQMQVKRRVVCVEKRTGRIIYSSDALQRGMMTLDIETDPGKHTVTLRMWDESVELAFTDKPVKPAPAAAKGAGEKKPAQSGAGNALLKALLGGKDE